MKFKPKKVSIDKKSWKKIFALFVIAVLVGAAFYLAMLPREEPGYETGKATIQDLLASQSTRKVEGSPTVATETSRYAPLVATPTVVYYEGSSDAIAKPLLIAGYDGVSTAVTTFLNYYGNPDVVAIGDLGGSASEFSVSQVLDGGTDEDTSIQVARHYWDKSDGAVLVKESDDGYNAAVTVVVLASYLNIPVIITDKVDKKIANALGDLGVRYTLVCGKMKGYKKVMHFDDIENPKFLNLAQDATITVLKERIGTDIMYVALANPLDTYQKEVLETYYPEDFPATDTVTNSDAAAYPGAAASTGKDNPILYFDVPEDYEYANVILDLWLDVSEEAWGDFAGARLYCYVGVDGDEDGIINDAAPDDKLQFFGGTPAFDIEGLEAPLTGGGPNDWMKPADQGHLHTEIPMYNDTGTHAIQLLARLPTDWGSNPLVGEDGDYEAEFTANVTVEKLAEPIYPLMENLSTLAPYLAAYRKGVVLSEPYFQLHDVGYIGCADCGDPAANEDVLDDANNQTKVVKADLNKLLGKIAGIDGANEKNWPELAMYYADLPIEQKMHVGIISDTNMVPQFYYHSAGQGDATEGFGIPSDIFYQDVDIEQDDNVLWDCTLEIAAGRIDGWSSQDVSALLGRTFFYYEIIDNIKGPMNGVVEPNGVGDTWKGSAMTALGTEPPVGAAITAGEKIGLSFEQAGFTASIAEFGNPISGHTMDHSRRQRDGVYYESSNFIQFCAHGFYYWYVPPAWEGASIIGRPTPIIPPIGAGGAFDVAHVKYMNFGPSVTWANSCVTGRIDGLQPENALSLAFLHAGMATYIGATRMSWGMIVPIPDAVSGESLGSLLALHFYAHLTGYLYDKDGGLQGFEPSDTTTGVAMMLAKNDYAISQGVDFGGSDSDTLEEFIIHGDPAFNPYEPNHN
jgi:hypothetical protein